MTASTRNLSLIFKAVPPALPVPGVHLTIEDRPIDLSLCPPNGLITRNIYASLDPYMRLMLIPPNQPHYRAPFELNAPLQSASIAEILTSNHPSFQVGQRIRARLPIQEYSSISSETLSHILPRLTPLPSSSSSSSQPDKAATAAPNFIMAYYLGPLGMPGQTAYSSIFEIGKPSAGETIFVSAASGAVGQLVCQICKQRGLRVIGSVGSREKLALIRDELGIVDDGFVYKEVESPHEALHRLCPRGIDIYYDNVGGEQLDAALERMNKDGRIVVCGQVSQYNDKSEERYGVKNLFQLVAKSLTMRGFQVGDREFQPKWGEEHEREVTRWLERGELKVLMSEMVGMENAAEAFVGMLEGKNQGKAVLRIHLQEGEEVASTFTSIKP